MYIYDIGYGSYEESQYWQYIHKEKFTEKQLRLIVGDCIFEVIEYLSRLKRRPTNRMNWVHFLEDGPTFQDIMYTPRFHDALKKRGFKPIEIEAETHVFGWASCIRNNWKDPVDSSDSTRLIINRLMRKARKEGIYIKTIKKERKRMNGKKYIDEEYKVSRKDKKGSKRKK